MFSVTKKAKQLTERGDTIVEVLIAIAIISSILSGAYIVVNKSLIAGREAQERGNALKLSEGQLERLKSLSSSNPDKLFNTTDAIFTDASLSFCVNDANELVPAKLGNDAVTDAACKVGADGNPTTEEPMYKLYIKRESMHTFILTTKWSSLKNFEDNSVQLIYKAY